MRPGAIGLKRPLAWLPAALLLAAMGGCVHTRPAVDDVSQVGSREVIVVGRIELNPPMADNDQNLHGIGSGRYKNRVYVITDEKWREKTDDEISPGDELFEAQLGETFYIKGSNKPFYFLTEYIFTEVYGNGSRAHVYLPGGVKIDVRNNDRAVYIGNIRFTRNEYFDITKAEIIDDYDRANAAFKKKFGVKYNLRKALAVAVNVKHDE